MTAITGFMIYNLFVNGLPLADPILANSSSVMGVHLNTITIIPNPAVLDILPSPTGKSIFVRICCKPLLAAPYECDINRIVGHEHRRGLSGSQHYILCC